MPARRDSSNPRTPGSARALRITASTVPGTAAVLRLEGKIDQEERLRLENALDSALTVGSPRLVVDLSGLEFCDSTGLNALLRTRLDAQAAHIELLIVAPRPQTRRLLDVTGTTEIFAIRPSLRAALDGSAG